MIRIKSQFQKQVKKQSSGIIQTVGGDESVLVTLKIEASGREAAERIYAEIADFVEKLDAGNSK